MLLNVGDIIISDYCDEKLEIEIKSVNGKEWAGSVKKVIKASAWRIGQDIGDDNTDGITIISKKEYKGDEKITAKNKKRLTFWFRKI